MLVKIDKYWIDVNAIVFMEDMFGCKGTDIYFRCRKRPLSIPHSAEFIMKEIELQLGEEIDTLINDRLNEKTD